MPVPNKYRLESCKVYILTFVLHRVWCVDMQPTSDYSEVVFLLRSENLDLMSLLSLITSWSGAVDFQLLWIPEGLCHPCACAGCFWAPRLHKFRGFPLYGHIRLVICGLAVHHGRCYCSSLQAKQERKCILLTVQQSTLLQPSDAADGPQPAVGAPGESIEMCPRPEAAPPVQG